MVEIKDNAHGKYNTNNQTKFNTTMLGSCLCGYSGGYILVKETLSVPNMAGPSTATDNNDKKYIYF